MRISDWSSDVCSSDLQRPDYLLIQRHVINIDALFIEYAQHYFAKNEPKAWEVLVQLEAKLNDKNIPRNMIGREKRVVALEQRSEEHTSELQSLMRISYAVFCLKKKKIE